MKKAIVIGGSNGIGLALSTQLINKGYYLYIYDIVSPQEGTIPNESFDYCYFNLLDFNQNAFANLLNDKSLEVLFITAGVGRIAKFEAHHIAEIDKMMTINATSTIKIIRLFYDRIHSIKSFYCGVMGSIAGWLVSPAASVYSASKASIVKLIESINIELELDCIENRVLDVSPSAFSGSRFYGGDNNLQILLPLADDILNKLFSKKTIFIPQYHETFKQVLNDYHNAPHEFGIRSFKYKNETGRIDNNKKVIIGYLSGTFDLFHVGHLNLLKRAKRQCDYLIVGVHEDGKWKGKETFISLEDRKEIVKSCRYVDMVVNSCREDSDAWNMWHFDKLFVGSDYEGSERFERYKDFFKDKNVQIVYFPYTQSISSSKIRARINEVKEKND